MTSPVIAGVIFTFWMLFGMGYFYGVLLWGVSKISWYFKTPHRNTPSFRLAASHELTNFMQRKLRFSPNFFAKTRLRASTILANFFHTYINMDKLKTVLLCTCFVIGLLPSFGQTPDGSPQVIFRFVEGKDMFYMPWNGNGGSLALRANLLRWATLSPDLGIEWRITPSVGIAVNGSWTSWSWDDKNRRYALWEVAPEVRWYLGEREAWYLGVMGKVGHFNYKFSETGRLGDIVGGGLTGGYMLRLNDAFSLDFGLGIGYLRADYDEYVVIDNVRVRSGEGSKNWWGPIHAGVTLVWTLF